MKRYVKSNTYDERQSNLSFDFSWSDKYSEIDIEEAVSDALSPYDYSGIDFVSMTDQYKGYNTTYPQVSQCNITFIHDGKYNPKLIERALSRNLEELGFALEGIDFHSID